VLLCAALAAYPARGSGGAVRLLVVGGVVAGLIVAITLLFEWETLAPWALGVLGAEYTGSLYVHGGASGNATPVYAAGLLLLGELIALSLAHQARLHEERPVLLLRLATIGLAVVGSAAVAAALLSLGTAQTGSGVGWTLAGTAAAVACVALVVRAVRSEH
jgi:hypothetical protein